MARERIGDLQGGKKVVPDGGYKFQVKGFRIKDANAGPLVIVDVMVVGPVHQAEFFGKHTELAFSTAGVALKPWLLAMGMSEDDKIEKGDKDELESILNTHCKGRIIFAEVLKVERDGYDNNQVDKPWVNVNAAELAPDDYSKGDDSVPF